MFEGLWSRNLHSKEFPNDSWTVRFSSIMGATHTSSYRFWAAGTFATRAMQEFVEHGSTASLERNFNAKFQVKHWVFKTLIIHFWLIFEWFEQEGKIRTIIKAHGPAYPKLYAHSSASIRVDPSHYQLSLASRLEPSPDWFVGVSGLSLCLPNCTWLDNKQINLYPWDAGTDAGYTYTVSCIP